MCCQAMGPDPPGSSGTSSASQYSTCPLGRYWMCRSRVMRNIQQPLFIELLRTVPFCESVSPLPCHQRPQQARWSDGMLSSIAVIGHLWPFVRRNQARHARGAAAPSGRRSSLQQLDRVLSFYLFLVLQVRNCQMRLRVSRGVALCLEGSPCVSSWPLHGGVAQVQRFLSAYHGPLLEPTPP